MKIATFNINNINRRLPNLLQWLKTARPDVVCLQELKATDQEFPPAALAQGRISTRFGKGRRPGTASPSWRATPSRS